ncbi:MAG TPA: hypothetical protein VF815_16070 [Myxococcaceae bacterium]
MRSFFQKLVQALFETTTKLLLYFSFFIAFAVFGGSVLVFTQLLQRFMPLEQGARWVGIALGFGVAMLWHWTLTLRLFDLMAAGIGRLQGIAEEAVGLAGPDPSAGWTAAPGVLLVFDLGKHTFCDVRPGQPLDTPRRGEMTTVSSSTSFAPRVPSGV